MIFFLAWLKQRRMRGAVVGWSRLKVEKRLFRVMAAEELPTSPRFTFERLRAILSASERDEGPSVASLMKSIGVAEFSKLVDRKEVLCLDARAPIEYQKGCMIGAVNFPLLSDEERANVGTAFKRSGRARAIEVGFEALAPKIFGMAERAKELMKERNASTLAIYCARGGMRSNLTGWFLREELGDLVKDVVVCDGGYKAYRYLVLNCYDESPEICIIGGRTGTGKTRLLKELAKYSNQQTIDLEGIAEHKGSAFGRIGEKAPQPSSEQFGNLLGHEWLRLDPAKPVFIEDEGPHVGICQLPPTLYTRMRNAPLVVQLEVPSAQRIRNLVQDYVVINEKNCTEEEFKTWQGEMKNAALRCKKRLGNERLDAVIEGMDQKNYTAVAEVLLKYYDKMYDFHLKQNRDTRKIVQLQMTEEEMNETPADAYYAMLAQKLIRSITPQP